MRNSETPPLTSSPAPLFESHLIFLLLGPYLQAQKPLSAPPLPPSQWSGRVEMPVWMPQAFQRHSVSASTGAGGGEGHLRGKSRASDSTRAPTTPSPHPWRWAAIPLQASLPSRAPGLCQLGPGPYYTLLFRQNMWVLADRNGRTTFLSSHWDLSSCFPTPMRQIGL